MEAFLPLMIQSNSNKIRNVNNFVTGLDFDTIEQLVKWRDSKRIPSIKNKKSSIDRKSADSLTPMTSSQSQEKQVQGIIHSKKLSAEVKQAKLAVVYKQIKENSGISHPSVFVQSSAPSAKTLEAAPASTKHNNSQRSFVPLGDILDFHIKKQLEGKSEKKTRARHHPQQQQQQQHLLQPKAKKAEPESKKSVSRSSCLGEDSGTEINQLGPFFFF